MAQIKGLAPPCSASQSWLLRGDSALQISNGPRPKVPAYERCRAQDAWVLLELCLACYTDCDGFCNSWTEKVLSLNA